MNTIVPKFDTRLNRCMIIVRCTECLLIKSYVNDLSPSHSIIPDLYSDFMSKQWRGLGVFKVSSVQSISVPLSLSMNNVHNTFFVATLIYNVVQHFLSQLKKTMLSLPLAFNT